MSETDMFAASEQPERICLRTAFMKERYNLPDDWEWHLMKVIHQHGKDPKDWEFTSYEGGVYPNKITRGPRKGKKNYKKPLPGSQATFVVGDREFKAWLPTWEARTGKCHKCHGTGQEWAGWHHKTGNIYRDCKRCAATGVPPIQEAAA